MTPTRPALRYHGGKWKLASWIISHFPPHACYVEPFGGAASVLLQKQPAEFEVYNDLAREVVAFFRVLRERPAELIQAINLTPYSRAEFELSYEPAQDELERARRFYVRSWQCRGGPTAQWRTGWRFQKANNSGWMKTVTEQWDDTAHLWTVATRLKHVQIECDEALAVIRRYDSPGTLFYVDPPYLPSTRSKWAGRAYRHEMTEEDHRELARVLRDVQGMVIVSGYPAALYDELYAGWRTITRQARVDTGDDATECLWISPAAQIRTAQMELPL